MHATAADAADAVVVAAAHGAAALTARERQTKGRKDGETDAFRMKHK